MLAQTPSPLPDAGALKDLDYRVALALIIAGVLLAFLTYFGGPIRDRLTRKPAEPPKPPDPPATVVTSSPLMPVSAAGAAVDAVDRAERYADRFIDNLLRQVQEAAEREDGLEARIRTLERQVFELQAENQRLNTMLWQRGPR